MLLGELSAEKFLADYWQQKPLLIRNALPEFADPLTANELAGLAMEEFIESRLISTDAETGECQLRHGPFAGDELQALPAENWTLLVQAVDQWVEAVAALRAQCDFLPQWRMDDVMVSFATPGGGVGPHFDQYDVFLLQGQGSRLWRVGPACDANTPQFHTAGVKGIAPFTPLEAYTLYRGDVLYLPPGIAHWGVAQTDCMTYSLGFRAPSHAELLSEWSHSVAENLPDQLRYTDPVAQDPAQAIANGSSLIDSHVIDSLQHILQQYVADRDALATWFGRWVTEQKYVEVAPDNEPLTQQNLPEALREHTHLLRAPATRVALSQLQSSWMLFVNGEAIPVKASSLKLARLLSTETLVDIHLLLPLCENGENCQLLAKLLANSSYVFINSQEVISI